MGRLTQKRRVWLEEYLTCWNATEAARRAGYAHPTVQGSRLLADVNIQSEIQQRLDELKMGADEVLLRLADQARLDPGPFVEVEEIRDKNTKEIIFSGPRVNWEKIQEAGLTHLVKAVYWTKYGPRVEFHDPQRALELIGKHHKLFTEKVEHSGEIRTKDVTYTDEQRANLISAIIDRARTRDTGPDSEE